MDKFKHDVFWNSMISADTEHTRYDILCCVSQFIQMRHNLHSSFLVKLRKSNYKYILMVYTVYASSIFPFAQWSIMSLISIGWGSSHTCKKCVLCIAKKEYFLNVASVTLKTFSLLTCPNPCTVDCRLFNA